ncbi:MAG: 3-methyl-2-oxobutanoate hydroxymethyltransferase [Phycisphaerales bacterium]
MYERPSSNPSPEGASSAEPAPAPVTLRTLTRMASRGEPFACLTAYDATTAKWLERAGVHLLLAGDSAAQLILGYDRTIDMPLDIAVALTAAVKRGAPNTVVMADMPFLTAHASDESAIRIAGRFMTEGMADIVKIEADASMAPLVHKMTRAGIAVCAHVGLLPQRVSLKGAYSAAGRTADDAQRLIDDAVMLERAGAVMILVEAIPPEVAEALVKRTSVPVIGIGAGPACHGQILVIQDLLGLTDLPPRFADPVAQMGPDITRAARTWVERVAARRIGGQAYTMREGEAEKLNPPAREQSQEPTRRPRHAGA